MKDSIAWLLKNLVLPLTPVLCGTLVRYFYSGAVQLEITDLSFSIAILYILLVKSSGGLTDKKLADSLSTICIVGIAICLTIFAYGTFVKLQFEEQVRSNHSDLLVLLAREARLDEISTVANSVDFSSAQRLMARVKTFMYGVAILSVPMTIIFRLRFKLDD